ncbi:MAG: hypothetical protein ACRY3E_03450, partial [Candidatus Lariskella arthropodorum]
MNSYRIDTLNKIAKNYISYFAIGEHIQNCVFINNSDISYFYSNQEDYFFNVVLDYQETLSSSSTLT